MSLGNNYCCFLTKISNELLWFQNQKEWAYYLIKLKKEAFPFSYEIFNNFHLNYYIVKLNIIVNILMFCVIIHANKNNL